MKLANLIWLTVICAMTSSFGASHPFRPSPVSSQHPQNDGGCSDNNDSFNVTAYVAVDTSYNVYGDSYMDVQSDNCDDIYSTNLESYLSQSGAMIDSGDDGGDDYSPADVQLQGSGYAGREYEMVADGYAFYSDEEDDGYGGWEYVGGDYDSVVAPFPPPQITSLSPDSVNQGDTGTLTISGSNFIQGAGDQLTLNFSGTQTPSPFTPTGTPTATTATFTYDFSGYPTGSYNITVTNHEDTSNVETFTVTTPPLQLTSISPDSAYPGDTLMITLQGTCTGTKPTVTTDASAIMIVSQVNSRVTYNGGGVSCGYTETINLGIMIDKAQPAGTFHFTVTNPDDGTSGTESFTVLERPNPCAVTSNPQSGYSSIVPTGTVGGTGTMTVSFSGAAFSALRPSVTYGPYSTPSSIASNIAALITKNYLRYGLSAKAFGPNIVYSGLANLGTVSNIPTGPSFTADPSSAAANAAEDLCDDAPPQFPPTILTATQNLWFFGRGNVPPPTFTLGGIKTVVTANGGLGGSFSWLITNGADKVSLASGSQTSGTTTGDVLLGVTVYAIGYSTSSNDVTIQLSWTPAGGGSPTILALNITVDSPYKLVSLGPATNQGVAGQCSAPALGTDGYQSLVPYRMVSFLGVTIANMGVNESFASNADDYVQNNWPPYAAAGVISTTGMFSDNLCAIVPSRTPPSLPPQSPLGTTKIDHALQAWFIGSTASASGVQVQSNILQRYQDHGLHNTITSPVR